MAKLKPSIIKLRGSVHELTFVDSKRYGRHARARRGTYTPVTINAALEKSKEQLLSSNKPAKLIFDAIRNEHKDGGLWTDLLSVFRKQLKEDKSFSLKGLLKLECSRLYALNKVLYNQFSLAVTTKRKKMQVTIDLKHHPKWEKKGYLGGYQLSIAVVYPDFKKDRFAKEVARTTVIKFTDEVKPLHFEIPMPATSAPWILFLGVAGAVDGKVADVPTTKAMAVVKVSSEL